MQPGQYLDEFQIIRSLGTGGFGTVYLAHDTSLDRHVAIKELHALAATDSVTAKRFLQEARTAGNLKHPHIVTVYALKSKDNDNYLILEYVSGGSVRDRLDHEGKLQMDQAVQIAAEVCDALAAVHAKGIIHRDIKPENILLTEEGRVKVSDFGIAHVPRHAGGELLTKTGFQPGTIPYMSPEQIRGDEVTDKSDVYQVAIVLYEMLLGYHYIDLDALLRQAMRELKASNPQAPGVQALWTVLVMEKIGGRVSLSSDIPAELARLIEGVISATASNRMEAQQLEKELSAIRLEGIQKPPPELGKISRGLSLPSQKRTYDDSGVSIQYGSFIHLQCNKVLTYEYIDELNRDIKYSPNNNYLWFGRGCQFFHLGYYDQAIADLSHALELDPNHIGSWSSRGDVYRMIGDYDLAIADFTRAIEFDPNSAYLWARRGEAYRLTRDYDQAISDHSQALWLAPNYDWTLGDRGYAYIGKGSYDQAIADFDQALDSSPKHSWYLAGRGEAYRLKGNFDKAIIDLCYAIDNHNQAIHDLNYATDFYPNYPHAWYFISRGDAYFAKGDYDQAIVEYTQSLRLDPKDKWAWCGRGDAYRFKSYDNQAIAYYDLAIDDYAHALELDPNYEWAWLGRAHAYGSKGEYDQAIADHSRALELDPNNASTWSGRGAVYSMKADYDQAISDYTYALELNPNYTWAWVGRGDAYMRKGDFVEAIADLSRARELDDWGEAGEQAQTKLEEIRGLSKS